MLILTRKVGETLMIGDQVEVTILSIKGNQVRIGVNAPKEIPVHREEIYLKVQEENRNASKSIKDDLINVVKLLKDKIQGKSSEQKRAPVNYKENRSAGKKNSNFKRPNNNR